MIGNSCGLGARRQGVEPSRSVRRTGWTLEADPQHAELIVERLGMIEARAATTPGVDGTEEIDTDDD